MESSLHDAWSAALAHGGAEHAFEALQAALEQQRDYAALFELLLLRARHDLGLPLLTRPAIDTSGYEERVRQAALRMGELYLAAGDIPRAWPYFRAVGETGAISRAIDALSPGADREDETLDTIIGIAFHERANPRKGFELLLQRHGLCRAIGFYEQFPPGAGRDESLQLLVRTLHAELLESLRRAFERAGESVDEHARIGDLIRDRDWLFGEYDYYVDTSHLMSILRFSLDLHDAPVLELAIDLAAYGRKLAPAFQYPGEPPFDDFYEDHRIYLEALAGRNTDAAVEHFRGKVLNADSSIPAQVLVLLLARLGRHREAAVAHAAHLSTVPPSELMCPPLAQLCDAAGNFALLADVARRTGDVVTFAAATLRSENHAKPELEDAPVVESVRNLAK